MPVMRPNRIAIRDESERGDPLRQARHLARSRVLVKHAARHAAGLAKAGKITAVAGGGDTVSALNHAGVVDDMTFVSTAGGAFLEWMEGKPLPGVEALKV